MCCDCAAKDQDKTVEVSTINAKGSMKGQFGDSDQIGWMVPAIPVAGETGMYWGYCAVPQEDCEMWYKLPTRLTPTQLTD